MTITDQIAAVLREALPRLLPIGGNEIRQLDCYNKNRSYVLAIIALSLAEAVTTKLRLAIVKDGGELEPMPYPEERGHVMNPPITRPFPAVDPTDYEPNVVEPPWADEPGEG
jgi:hypothetical protein